MKLLYSPFSLTNKATGLCLVRRLSRCLDLRWTTGNRLLVTSTKKCLGAQGKSVGSEVNQYDCDEKSLLQRWECKNDTLLALRGQQLYMEVKSDGTIALTKTAGPNTQITITDTASGACTRTHRELYSIGGNAFGKICMFPFLYKDRWYGDCTMFDSKTKRYWCAVETKYEHEQWGYCPSSSTEHWSKEVVTGTYYQINTQSALTWAQADASCKQQASSLLSITDPVQQAVISALLGSGRNKLWIGLVLDTEHGWKWTDGKPFRYLKWDSGNPQPNPGHNCGLLDSSGQFLWESSSCTKKMGYICYKVWFSPTLVEEGFCSDPWIPYNGHCFHLHRTPLTWADAQKECRKEGGDLSSIYNVEDQSFVISQLGYASSDELWIGLNDRSTEGLFEWSDHSTVSFTSWEFGKPLKSTSENCVLLRGENGNWADRYCEEKHGFICMKQSSSERTGDEVDMNIGCKAGWKKHGSYCYFIGTETKTFDEANNDCKTSNSYLVDVSNGVDNAFLVSLVGQRPEKNFWLGLSNQNNIDVFVWTNTDQVKFTHWNAGMPGHAQGCVAMATGISAGLWDLLPCTNKEKYICKHQAEGAVLTVPPPTLTPPQCAEDWTRVGSRNICYKFFTGPRSEEKTWFEARDYCRAIGGDLLSIHSQADLISRRGGKAWIGLHIADPNTGYVWSDGSPVNFLHWQEGEPNNHNNAESCAEVQIYSWDENGSWNDANCESYNDWLCQIRAGVTPKAPPNNTVTDYNKTADGWIQWKGREYFINTMPRSMEDARHFCQRHHADLVSIGSLAENIFLWKLISRSYGAFYIGLSVDLDGSYWWTDGSPILFQQWDQDQPSTTAYDQNCVSMKYQMGFWSTYNCGRELQSICKRTFSPSVNTTAAPTAPPKGGCTPPWIKFDKKCYNIISDRKATWEEARKQCIRMRSTLVAVPSRQVQAFLTIKAASNLASNFWIGLSCLNQDGFYWADGSSRSYTNWGYKNMLNEHRALCKQQMNSNVSSGIGKWIIKSCNDTYGFICQKKLDESTQDQGESINPNIYTRLGNDSIKALPQNLTWEDAMKACKADNANLASIRSELMKAQVDLLAFTLKAPLWIGINKNKTGGSFKYVDGWHMSFAKWAELEPSRDRPCVYVDQDGNWRTAFCNQTMKSLCMQTTDVPLPDADEFWGRCPEDTNVEYQESYTWVPYRGYCYLFVTEEIEWADAASSCVRHGGLLASIEDPLEQQFIKSNIEMFQDVHTSFWIGLYKTHKGEWLWLDYSFMTFTNWAPEEPDSEYGAIMTSDGSWTTGRRWHDKSYICKTYKAHRDPERSNSRVHSSLVVVLLIAIISALIAVGFFLYKRSPLPLPTFENPLYFNSEPSQPDVVDTNRLIENAETPEPIVTL
uniref:Mannose receptor, C type 1b n=1 Tax=Oryzias sinensis TaxID=183150 RepID=A0A8C7Z677_9TELE